MDNVYYTTQTKPKSDASKSVMSSKRFTSVPELFRPKLCNTRMKFQVASGEVLNSIGVAHVSIQLYGYTFKLPIFVCDIDCIFEMLEKRPVLSNVYEQAESGLTQMSMVNQNSCLGVVVMLYAIFEQFR